MQRYVVVIILRQDISMKNTQREASYRKQHRTSTFMSQKLLSRVGGVLPILTGQEPA